MRLAGSLPPGVPLSHSGVPPGTPTTAGTYHFALLATDTSSGRGSVRDYTLTIPSQDSAGGGRQVVHAAPRARPGSH